MTEKGEFSKTIDSDQLKTLGDDIRPAVDHQEVDVVGSHHVVEDTQAKAFFGFKKPGMPATSVF